MRVTVPLALGVEERRQRSYSVIAKPRGCGFSCTKATITMEATLVATLFPHRNRPRRLKNGAREEQSMGFFYFEERTRRIDL